MKTLPLLALTWGCTLLFCSATPLQPYYLDDPQSMDNAHMTPEQKDFFAHYHNVPVSDMSQYFVMEEAIDPADSVSSLLGAINFSQSAPYNNACPLVEGGRAVTGCVATAMAMVMTYYRYPQVGTGSVKYTSREGEKTLDLSKQPFDWANMLPTYQGSGYTEAQANAVANLSLCCGASINMQYGVDGSGTKPEKVPSALKNNFSYDRACTYYTSVGDPDPQSLIEDDWVYTIRAELKAKHPVIYAGSPAYGQTGHCFVFDGYKVINNTYYYHVNWGWNGAFNGYFLITKLQPNPQVPAEHFSGYGCEMVVGIYPPGWTAVEEVKAPETDGIIYTILGTRVREEDLQHGQIYIRNGRKFMY